MGKGLNVVIPEKKFIFMTVPKAAGTTIRAAILESLKAKNIENKVHRHPALNLTHNKNIAYLDEYFKFTFVRNPWDRLLSTYRDKLQYREFVGLAKRGFYCGMPFKEYIEKVCAMEDAKAEVHVQSQYYRLHYQGMFLPDFVGYYEFLEDDWEDLLEQTGLKGWFAELKKLNVSPSKDDFYDEETWEMVRERFKKDIQFFGYEDLSYDESRSGSPRIKPDVAQPSWC